MEFELVIFLVMLGVFLLGNFLLKLPVSLSMAAGAIAGALVGGEGIPPAPSVRGHLCLYGYGAHHLHGHDLYDGDPKIRGTGGPERRHRLPLPQGPGGHADSADAHHHVPGHDHGLLHRRGAFRRRYRGPHPADDGHPGPQTGAILAVGAIMGMAAPR